MLKVRLNRNYQLPFALFYLCDQEELSSLAASFDCLLVLHTMDYRDNIFLALEKTPKLEEEEKSTIKEATTVKELLAIPISLNSSGVPLYLSNTSYKEVRAAMKAEQYLLRWRRSGGLTRYPRQQKEELPKKIFKRHKLIYLGIERGSPCSKCPKVLESLEGSCVLGGSQCLGHLNFKEFWPEKGEDQ